MGEIIYYDRGMEHVKEAGNDRNTVTKGEWWDELLNEPLSYVIVA